MPRQNDIRNRRRRQGGIHRVPAGLENSYTGPAGQGVSGGHQSISDFEVSAEMMHCYSPSTIPLNRVPRHRKP